jgi:ATP-dependent exoDNAse (exonuclease V) beta subunit
VSRRAADGFESYYIDLLLRSTSDDRLRIVDYKTTMPDPSETPQDFERRMLETYQAQMNIYVAIISKMEGRAPEAFLFLTHTQRLVQFDATTLRETT